jgi:LuxR family transcriptional regulator, maltose regulon positive regulatory protein
VPIALLETKLYVPRPRRDRVLRPRLSERLDRGTASKLVLVSAPAGFGKTTLLTEWLEARPAAPADERLAAWLSLDRGDNDPASFWTYVIAALRTVASGVGESALARLDAPQPPPIETVLTTLLNDLGAGALLIGGELEGVEGRLRDAERWLEPTAGDRERPRVPSAEMVVADEDEYRRLPATIELYRAGQALAWGDAPGTVRHAQRAIELALDDDYLCRASASGLLGLVYWGSGDLDAGHRAYSACVDGLRRAGFVADILGCSIALADIRSTQGRLGEALRTYEQALQLAGDQGGSVLRGTADMYVGMSEIARERDDLRAATQLLLRSQELGEHTGLPQNRYRWRVAMARAREAEGDLRGALDILNEAERLYVSDFFPNVRPVPALRARVWIAQGRLGDALSWAREQGLSVDDQLSYLREFEHITLARLLLARYQGERAERSAHEAARLLERLLLAAEAGGRTGRVIEILVLRALAHQALGDIPAALAALERAVTLAEPEGYVRIFADEGSPMTSLLKAAAKQETRRNYVRRLLAATSGIEHNGPTEQALIEPLSERELDVLRLLGSELDGPAIARELMVSLNTMRTHTKNIYAKLAVTSRRAAVRRTAELNLLPRTRSPRP